MAPINKSNVISMKICSGTSNETALEKTSENFNESKKRYIRNIPRRKPTSPILLTTNAFNPAADVVLFSKSLSYQNPISRYEQRPTPSQPKNINTKLSAIMRFIIAKMKRLRYAKNLQKALSPCI